MNADMKVPVTLLYPNVAWRCFHCDQVFTDYRAAEAHFGKRTTEPPDCGQYLGAIREARKERDEARAHLRTAVRHIDHMAAWISARNAGYSFEGLGEDMPDIRTSGKPK